MKKRVTIAEIARKAGVSVGTASNVFNGKGRFAPSTRDRVLQVATDLSFAPNALIRSLQSGKTHTIGVFTWAVTSDPARDVTMLLLKGLSDSIAESGYDTLLYSHLPHHGEAPASRFLDRRIDGLILGPGGVSPAGLAALAQSHVPVVALYETSIPDGVGSVNIDNLNGVIAAVDHLVELGHRRIAFHAPTFTHDFRERAAGYRMGLERHEIQFDPSLRLTPGAEYCAEAGATCDYLLGIPEPPTAVIAADDRTARAFLEELRNRGVSVPREMSVVGFDDAPAAAIPPGLTTIRQPAEDVGRTAAKLLRSIMAGAPAETCRTVLPVELVVRGTTAAPAPRGGHPSQPRP